MAYTVVFSDAALDDLQGVFDYIEPRAGERIARRFVERLYAYCLGFDIFPERGTRRDDLRSGLRIVGYRRKATIAFTVAGDEVIILRVFYAGRDVANLEGDEDGS